VGGSGLEARKRTFGVCSFLFVYVFLFSFYLGDEQKASSQSTMDFPESVAMLRPIDAPTALTT
jgi:hypothetical protein